MVVGEATAVAQPRFRTLHVNGMAVLTVVAAVLLAYLLLVPLAMTIVTSFRGPEGLLPFEPQARTTLEHYASIYGRGGMWLTLRDTAIYVGGSVLLGFAIGFLLAW